MTKKGGLSTVKDNDNNLYALVADLRRDLSQLRNDNQLLFRATSHELNALRQENNNLTNLVLRLRTEVDVLEIKLDEHKRKIRALETIKMFNDDQYLPSDEGELKKTAKYIKKKMRYVVENQIVKEAEKETDEETKRETRRYPKREIQKETVKETVNETNEEIDEVNDKETDEETDEETKRETRRYPKREILKETEKDTKIDSTQEAKKEGQKRKLEEMATIEKRKYKKRKPYVESEVVPKSGRKPPLDRSSPGETVVQADNNARAENAVLANANAQANKAAQADKNASANNDAQPKINIHKIQKIEKLKLDLIPKDQKLPASTRNPSANPYVFINGNSKKNN